MALDNYYASYPLEYYNVGTCYSFYIHGEVSTPASEDQIGQYSKELEKIIKSNPDIMENDDVAAIAVVSTASPQHVIGIVTGKGELPAGGKYKSYISVMFKTTDRKYITEKYSVEGPNAFFDNYPNGLKTSRVEIKSGPTVPATPAGPTAVPQDGPTVA